MNGADRLKPNKLVHNLGKMYVCKLEFGIAAELAIMPEAEDPDTEDPEGEFPSN